MFTFWSHPAVARRRIDVERSWWYAEVTAHLVWWRTSDRRDALLTSWVRSFPDMVVDAI